MKNFILGFVLGGVFFGSVIVWAAERRIILITTNESPLGTAENPLYIQ